MEQVTLTKRGQISVPAALRKAMRLRPGQRLKCLAVSGCEFRVFIEAPAPAGAMAALGWAQKLGIKPGVRTADVMRELREGDDD